MSRSSESGFTLIEALIAILILVFGLTAVMNLFIVAGSANRRAREMTATTAAATEVMEVLKGVPFLKLVPASVDNDQIAEGVPYGNVAQSTFDVRAAQLSPAGQIWTEDQEIDLISSTGNVDVYGADRVVEGIGEIRIRWEIMAVDDQTRIIRVAAQAPILRQGSKTELIAFRSCTVVPAGCPATP